MKEKRKDMGKEGGWGRLGRGGELKIPDEILELDIRYNACI